ncbi:hypothetical protein C9374_008944 [Naegleria lovaniensis]|uniref:Uncharacterized protein n=1 Tax=Naegleria lovaniensis TaxID=51637 RepID=A0AA88GEF6_NAELO|nr:uncharacterized protein C9374_008944 [Naegleria lovaniensis]KAG2377859.1 hypothetical protein C9374_008944 [Naegleria lovaniensis]
MKVNDVQTLANSYLLMDMSRDNIHEIFTQQHRNHHFEPKPLLMSKASTAQLQQAFEKARKVQHHHQDPGASHNYEEVKLEGKGYSVAFKIPKGGWRDQQNEDYEKSTSVDAYATKATEIIGAGLPSRIVDIDVKEFDRLMQGETGITFTNKLNSCQIPFDSMKERDKAIHHALETHKAKVISKMRQKYKRMTKRGIFDDETNRIRVENMLRCSFSRFDPAKIHDILLQDSGFDHEILNRVRGIGGGGGGTPRHGKSKAENSYAFLSGLYNDSDNTNENDQKRPDNPNAILSKIPAASEKKIHKNAEETSPVDFLDKILSFNMTPITPLSRNPFLSEDVKMVLDRDLGDVGMDGPRHRFSRNATAIRILLPKKREKESKEKLSARGKNSDSKKKKFTSPNTQEKTESEEIILTSKQIKEMIKYDPSKSGEKLLSEVMPSIEYSVAEMLERILEDEEKQQEEEQMQAISSISASKTDSRGSKLVFDARDTFFYETVDSTAEMERVVQREAFINKEFQEFKPKEIERQKEQLTNANMKKAKLTIHNLQNIHMNSEFQELLSPKSKTMHDDEWKKRDKEISDLCDTLEKLIIDICREMKQFNESKLNSSIIPQHQEIERISDTLITCLKRIPFDWNSRTKREWAQGAEVLLMWQMKLSSPLNINKEDHIKDLARFYVRIFYENDVLMKNLFLHYKEAVIDEIKNGEGYKKMKAGNHEDITLPKINAFTVWSDGAKNSEVDDLDLFSYPQSFDQQRQRVSNIKKMLFIIINYVNHCNSYTKDVFGDLVLFEKDRYQKKVLIRKATLKESGKKKEVQSMIEERGLSTFAGFLSSTNWENIPRSVEKHEEELDSEVYVHRERDFYTSIFSKDVEKIVNNIRESKESMKLVHGDLSQHKIEPVSLTKTANNQNDVIHLHKTSFVNDEQLLEESLEYQRSYLYQPPNLKMSSKSPSLPAHEKKISPHVTEEIQQSLIPKLMEEKETSNFHNSFMFTPSEPSFRDQTENTPIITTEETSKIESGKTQYIIQQSRAPNGNILEQANNSITMDTLDDSFHKEIMEDMFGKDERKVLLSSQPESPEEVINPVSSIISPITSDHVSLHSLESSTGRSTTTRLVSPILELPEQRTGHTDTRRYTPSITPQKLKPELQEGPVYTLRSTDATPQKVVSESFVKKEPTVVESVVAINTKEHKKPQEPATQNIQNQSVLSLSEPLTPNEEKKEVTNVNKSGRKSSQKGPKWVTPEVTSIHETKSRNLRKYSRQRKKLVPSVESTDNDSTKSSTNISVQDFTPSRATSPISAADLHQLTISLAHLDDSVRMVSSRSSNYVALKDDSPKSTRSTISVDKKNKHSGKWMLKSTVFQSFFDSPLYVSEDVQDTKKKDEVSYDKFDSVTLLEKLEQTWDDLLIPAATKMKLYQKYSSSKYIGNVNLMKDAAKTWKLGASSIIARESVLLQMNEYEKSLAQSASKLPSFSDKVQEQKLRSNLFKRLSVIASECEKYNRKLKKDHDDQLMYKSSNPYVEKMKTDYLSIVAGIENLAEEIRPVDFDVVSPRSLNTAKKNASVTVCSTNLMLLLYLQLLNQ